MKMAIITMLRRTLTEVEKLTIAIEEEMLVRIRNMVKYH
jgi:hypothetical protein